MWYVNHHRHNKGKHLFYISKHSHTFFLATNNNNQRKVLKYIDLDLQKNIWNNTLLTPQQRLETIQTPQQHTQIIMHQCNTQWVMKWSDEDYPPTHLYTAL